MGFGGKLGLSGLAGIVMALALASPAFAQVPDAPTIGTAWGGDRNATVFFTAPASNGGPAITGYTITSSPGGITAGGAGYTSPISIYGLTNGTPHTFTVTATNAVGTSPASAASNSVTPKGNQVITFTNPGTQLFGTTPTLSASSTSGLPVSFSSSTMSVCTTSSGGTLTFIAPGSCAIEVDQDGDGAWNAASTVTQTFTVNAVSPDAPTIGTATAGDGQATVSFTPPTSNGGSNITAYTVTSNPGGLTETGSNSPITVTCLTNGVSYTFTVTATNATSLTGIASAASNSVTPVAAQSIIFTNPGQQLNTASLTVTATADSGLPVSFSATTPAVCTVTSIGVVTFTGLGICTLEANQPGTGSYLAASTVTQSFNVVSGTIVLSPTGGALPAGRIWLTYGQTIALSGGTAPFVYSVTAGALPAGLSLTGGMIAGTPTASSIAVFTLMVTDANGVVASAAYTLAITQSAAVTLSPPAGVLPQAMTGEGYEQTITATGAVGAVTYAISAGALPSGLALNGATGLISGTVTGGATTTSFSVSVTDSQGNTGVAHYQLQVLAREVTSPVIEVSVPAGSTPIPVNLTAGATGGPFTSGFVESVMPLEAGTARITGADVAAINTNYAALYLRFTPNPQFTGRAVVTYRLLNNQGAWAQGTVSYTLSADLSAVARQVQTLSDGFVTTRGGLLAGAVDTPGLLSRRAAGRAQMPGTISVTPSGNSVSMNFAASTLATNAASTAVESLINAPVDNGGLNFWIDGNATLHVRNDSVGNHWGSLGVVSVGGDALVTKDLLVGVALHIDWMDDVTNASRVWGTGLLIGPYMSAELVDRVFLDASAYYGQSWNSIFTGPFNGTFETQRFLAKAALSGQWALGDNLTLEPAANLFYLREAASAYTGSDGQGNSAGIASFALDQLRASVGTTLRYRMDLDGELAIVPFLGVELGLSLTNGIGGQFGSVSTGFDITGLGAWTPGLGVKTGLEDGALRSVSATGRAQANF